MQKGGNGMICPKCKTEVAGAAVFCPECGANMMETVSEAAGEFKAEARENAEAAFEETAERADYVEQELEDTTEKVDSAAETVAEKIQEPVSFKATNVSEPVAAPVYAPAPEAAVFAAAPVVTAPVASQKADQAADKAAKKAAKKETKKKAKEALKEIPKEIKPFSTGGAFWYLFLAAIPVVGFIALLAFAFGGKNKNRKSMSRAILLWMLIGLIITVAVCIAAYILFPELIEDLMDAGSLEEINDIILDELAARFD